MKIHGADISNYFNIIKHIALETDLPVEFVFAVPSQEEQFLPLSPMGKIPAAESANGALSETRAILSYIGNMHPDNPLFVTDAWDKARTEELMSITDLYIESQARRLLGELVFKGPRDDRAHEEVKGAVQKGLQAFGRRASLSPYLLGNDYSVIDVYVFYCLFLASRLMQDAYNWDIFAEVDGLQEWYDLMNSKETTQKVQADQAAFMKNMGG